MLAERSKNILHQRLIALAVAADQKLLGAAAIALRPFAHGVGKQLANPVIAAQAETLGKPGQRCRCDAGATGLLAHRQQRDVGRMIDDPARRLFQLRRQVVKSGLEPRIEGRKPRHPSILVQSQSPRATFVS